MIEGMKKKRLIWGAALLAGLVSTAVVDVNVSFAKTSADFSDLKDLDAATKAKFDAMISAGIFDGVSDSNFGLKDEMNRAQFAKVAALIYGLKVDTNLKTSSFSDVKADDAANGYALPYIEAVKKAGITEGTGDGKFDPAGEVTKEQLATFLVRGLGEKEANTVRPGVTDDTVSDWAKGYVALAIEKKLLANGADGKFGGNTNGTRDLLLTGAYEAKKEFVQNNPLQVTNAEFAEGNKLNLTLNDAIDEKSVDLSKITVNGEPLDPKKESYELSADGKTLVITLNDAFTLDDSKTPDIKVEGLKTPFGNEVKQEANKPLVVVVQTPPKAGAQKPTPAPVPAPTILPITEAPTNPTPVTPVTPNPEPTNPVPPIPDPTIPPIPDPTIPDPPIPPIPDPTIPDPPILPIPDPTIPDPPILPIPDPTIPTIPPFPNPGIPPLPNLPTPTTPDPNEP